jgi:8-oxo-dGTP diphosphatase
VILSGGQRVLDSQAEGVLKKQIEVVAAVIVRDGLVLCAKRGPDGKLPGMWEFPGGKVEAGESPRDALTREIDEELRCAVSVGDQIEHTIHEYDFAVVSLTTFYCELLNGLPRLTEHSEVRWSSPSELTDLGWAPADVPAVTRIQADFA